MSKARRPRRRLRCNGHTPFVARFWLSFRKGPKCWTWTGATNSEGYPQIRFNGRIVKASRAAWYLATGKWPPRGKEVCHHCDNPACVRKAHLFLASHRVNMLDMARKGRARNGATGRAA